MSESNPSGSRTLSLVMGALLLMCTAQVWMRLAREPLYRGNDQFLRGPLPSPGPSATSVMKGAGAADTSPTAAACQAHLVAIDRLMAQWEAQAAPLPADQEFWVDIRSDGDIEWLSPNFDAFHLTRSLDAGKRLSAPGGDTLRKLAGDPSIFACPQPVPGHALPGAVHYRWISGPNPRPDFAGAKRGTVCLSTSRSLPGSAPSVPHTMTRAP